MKGTGVGGALQNWPTLSIEVAACVVSLYANRMTSQHTKRRWGCNFIVAACCVGGALILWPAVENAREAPRELDCRGQLKQIGLALHNYHDVYSCLPPAFFSNERGQAIHSWRIMILPYWDRADLYSEYDFNETWNHPTNAGVAAHRTDAFFYGCYSSELRSSGMTNYLAVIGEGTAWPGRASLTFDDFTDDLATTVLVLEVQDHDILWLEPKDITLEHLLAQGLDSNHSNHVNAVFADGSVGRIRKDIDANTLRALLTISGGETVDPKTWQATKAR